MLATNRRSYSSMTILNLSEDGYILDRTIILGSRCSEFTLCTSWQSLQWRGPTHRRQPRPLIAWLSLRPA